MLERLASPTLRNDVESVVHAEFNDLELKHDRGGRPNCWTDRTRVSRSDIKTVRKNTIERIRKNRTRYGLGPIFTAVLYAVVSWAIKRWLDRRFPKTR